MNIQEISVTEAKELLGQEQAVFVDIRDPQSYAQSHIKGALSVNDSNIGDFLKDADKKVVHIIYCYHGNSSKSATAYFQDSGFEQVFSMAGGHAAWAQDD